MKCLAPLLYLCLLFQVTAKAQTTLSQNIKGVVIDADSKKPLAGAAVMLLNSNKGTTTDSLGQFKLNNINVGRQSLTISSLGYETRTVSEIMVSSGKEISLTISLTEEIKKTNEVTVTSRKSRIKPLNEFATASARQFSVEDTKRYPAAAYDPARMAMNFAGVSSNGDGNNEIVVRGNSPRSILWRLEGVEIPNPNHFSSLGAGGGAISMLSSSTLGNSDFYTGAFPAEIGNTTAGAFDLNFREGNKDKREYAFMVGGLGIEASAEGPFRKGGKSSYLINYRYSTLALLKGFLDNLGGVLPEYQDLSFKFNFVTPKAGTFSLFGLGGYNRASADAEKDSTKWNDDNENFLLEAKGRTGVAGLSHQYFLNRHSYIKTILSASYVDYREEVDSLNQRNSYSIEPVVRTKNAETAYRISMLYNNKLDSKNTFRTGIIASQLKYGYNSRYYDKVDRQWRQTLNGNGSSGYYQAYAQWKHRFSNQLSANAGLHASLLALNKTYSIEPRLSLTYSAKHNQTFTLATGIHAKPENLGVYRFIPQNYAGTDQPNKNLEMPKAFHVVLGYEKGFATGWRLKTEAYYQHLYDVPVEQKADSYFSMLNSMGVYDLTDIGVLTSTGKGKNYGVDITVEKPFNKNYYVLFTSSIYASKYTNFSGKEFNTRYNRNYQTNLVAGKEWKTGTDKKNIIGFNAKILASGGLRNSPIDIAASRTRGKVVYVNDQYYTQSGDMYYRFDIGFSYKKNRKHSTHTISFDIQNVTNHQNLFYEYYDNDESKVKKEYQMGFFPVINYRIEF